MTDRELTSRGFRVYLNRDSGDGVRVSQSSCVASGDTDFDTYPVRIYGGIDPDGHVHLSVEQARKVRDALTVYLDEAEPRGAP